MIRSVLFCLGSWLLLSFPIGLWAQDSPSDRTWQTQIYQYAADYVRFNALLLQQVEPVNRQLAQHQGLTLDLIEWQRVRLPQAWAELRQQAARLRLVIPSDLQRQVDALQQRGDAALGNVVALWASSDTTRWRAGLDLLAQQQRDIQAAFMPLRQYLQTADPAAGDIHFQLFLDFLQQAEAIQSGLRQGESPTLNRDYHALRSLWREISRQQTEMLDTWPHYPGSSRDPELPLRTWLGQADRWLDYLEAYLGHTPLAPPFSQYPLAYAYGQFRLLPLYNGQGQGLLDSFAGLYKRVLGRPLGWPPLLGAFEPFEPPKKALTLSREPSHYILILDVSASMRNGHKWQQVMAQLDRWIPVLQPTDRLSLIACGAEIEVWEAGQPSSVIQSKIETWKAYQVDGGSNIAQALQTAYRLAGDPWVETASTQVLLITDGGFEIPFSALVALQRYQEQGISLHTTYTGKQEAQMRKHLIRLAEMGGGEYWYLNARGLFPLSHLRAQTQTVQIP